MRDAVRVPHKRARNDDLVDAARRMLAALEPHAPILAQLRVDPKRLQRLRRALDRFEEARAGAGEASAVRRAHLKTFDATLSLAHSEIRALDGMRRELPIPIGEWRAAARVGKKLGRPRKRKGKQTS